MATAINVNRVNAPQAFVSSYAPRIRSLANSLLNSVQAPQSATPAVRTTKRGTTAINYSEDFDHDSIDDSDAPSRRGTGLRTAQQRKDVGGVGDVDGDRSAQREQQSRREVHAPVDVQGIWRDWMGKPKRALTEKQLHLPAALPTTLVPIRIDLDIAPFRPEAALPTPGNARDYGIDENLPAYKAPDVTTPFRLKDTFTWNLYEQLITPDQFAKTFVDELDFPLVRKPAMILEIASQIRQQLEEHAATSLHPLFQPIGSLMPPQAPSREDSEPSQPADTAGTTLAPPPAANGSRTPGASTPGLPIPARPTPHDSTPSPTLHPPDTHRCVLNISINLQNKLYTDKFEWSLSHPPGVPELFARQTCADLGLSGEWVPMMAHAIYEASLRLKKDMLDNGGTLAGVVGSGVDGWGVVENEACEYHGTAESATGVGAGWRFDQDALGMDWEPKIEVLSKEEIEKREGDRERQLRRARRETARFTTAYAVQAQAQSSGLADYFAGGIGSSAAAGPLTAAVTATPQPDDERMGRGERSKKKRRFRSLSPAAGRDTPEAGSASQLLSEGERQYWRCSHCRIWGAAVWGVRDGPLGPRTLCPHCGLLFDAHRRPPRWSHNLFRHERTAHPAAAAARPAADLAPFHPPASPTHAHAAPADFAGYAQPGEDLDWTRVQDARERRRRQSVVTARKCRERRLVAEGREGSGGVCVGAKGGVGGGG